MATGVKYMPLTTRQIKRNIIENHGYVDIMKEIMMRRKSAGDEYEI